MCIPSPNEAQKLIWGRTNASGHPADLAKLERTGKTPSKHRGDASKKVDASQSPTGSGVSEFTVQHKAESLSKTLHTLPKHSESVRG